MSFNFETKVGRARTVYAKDGHSIEASHYDEPKTIRQWDYTMAEHGGLAGITDREGRRANITIVGGYAFFVDGEEIV